jgi:predicted RNA-binding protein YlxR (DUF448 family)/ribosomal protein L7Ae-like RNA K-turn-binding protein
MVRWFVGPDGTPWPDWGGKSERLGRGVWLEPTLACLKQAVQRRAFERGLELEPQELDVAVLVERARLLGERRFFERIGLANRARKVSVGQTAVRAEFSGVDEGVLLVASDAGEAGRSKFGRSAGTKGVPVVELREGARLGGALGREFVSVAWVHPGPFADELERMGEALFGLDSEAISGYVARTADARKGRGFGPEEGS